MGDGGWQQSVPNILFWSKQIPEYIRWDQNQLNAHPNIFGGTKVSRTNTQIYSERPKSAKRILKYICT